MSEAVSWNFLGKRITEFSTLAETAKGSNIFSKIKKVVDELAADLENTWTT